MRAAAFMASLYGEVGHAYLLHSCLIDMQAMIHGIGRAQPSEGWS